MTVAGLVVAGALAVGAGFALLLNSSLLQVYRSAPSSQRRLVLTRGLPVLLAGAALLIISALLGAATGHGALAGVLVAGATVMGIAVPLLVIVSFVEAFRSSRH